MTDAETRELIAATDAEINRPHIAVWRNANFILRKLWVTVESVERDADNFVTVITMQSVDKGGIQGEINLEIHIDEPLNALEARLRDAKTPMLVTYSVTRAAQFKIVDVTA